MDQPIRAIFVTRDRHMPPVTGNFVSPKKHIFFRRYILCFFQSTENYSAASPPYGKYQQKEGQDSMGCGGCPYLVIKTTPPKIWPQSFVTCQKKIPLLSLKFCIGLCGTVGKKSNFCLSERPGFSQNKFETKNIFQTVLLHNRGNDGLQFFRETPILSGSPRLSHLSPD